MAQYFKPVLFVAVPFAGSIPNGIITRNAIKEWYDDIKKPSWNPPKWVFGPVWTSLYAAMGTASYLVYRDGGGFSGDAKTALALYGTQLALNFAWTPIFFGQKQFGLAYAEILALWGTIGGCIYTFRPINKTASLLLVPYLLWVTYASTINLYVWRNNPKKAAKIEEITETKNE